MSSREIRDERVVTLPVNISDTTGKKGFYGLYLLIAPSLLPPICSRCGRPGKADEELLFRSVLPRWIRLILRTAFVIVPVLFVLIAMVVRAFGGAGALNGYLDHTAIPFVIFLVTAFFVSLKSVAIWSREQWGLVFRFCEGCAGRYRRLRRWLRVVAAFAILILPIGLLVSLMLLFDSEMKLNWTATAMLLSFFTLEGGAIGLLIAVRRARGLSASWLPSGSAVEITFADPLVAARVRPRQAQW
jgi:hypothetical protein